MTMQLGMPAVNSWTWPGPSHTAARAWGSSSSTKVVRRLPVPASRPFMHSTRRLPSPPGHRAAISRSSPRSPWAPTEITTVSRSRASARLWVRRMLSGKVVTPLVRVATRASIRAEPSRP